MSTNKKSGYGQDILVPQNWDVMQDAITKARIDPRAVEEIKKMVHEGGFAREFDGMFGQMYTEEDLREGIQKVNESIRAAENQKRILNEALEFFKTLKFKTGDAAFHRNLGNVLVQGVLFNSTPENSCYVILMNSGKRGHVPLDELLPISEATKVLYGR